MPWSFLCNSSISCWFPISLLKLKCSHKESVGLAVGRVLLYIGEGWDHPGKGLVLKGPDRSLGKLQSIALLV